MRQLHWFRLVNFVHGVIASIVIYQFCVCVLMRQLHWFRLVNFVHGVIASILIYEFVCMCPHASVTLVSTGQLRPWGDS